MPLKNAVMHYVLYCQPLEAPRLHAELTIVVATTISQKVKKAPADAVNPTIKYNIKQKTETWNRTTGISAVIWATQKAMGWKNAKDFCLSRTGRPVKESVTSDMDMSVLKKIAKKQAPDFINSPAEVSGAS
jgi:hypothetical protein